VSLSTSNERLLLKELSRWVLYSSALCLLVLCAIYVYLSWEDAEGKFAVIGENMLKDSVTHLIPLTILFLVSSLVLERHSDLRERVENKVVTQQFGREVDGVIRRALHDQNFQPPVRLHERFDDVDWIRLLADASRIDVIVHYLDDWTRRVSHSLERILANGGTLRVILPNYAQQELVQMINARLPGLSEAEVGAKIQKTHERLVQLLSPQKEGRGMIETCFVSKPIWYSAFCVDDRVLLLSTYDHERGVRIESPVTEIDLEAYPAVRVWLHGEIDRLILGAVEKQTS
jgi:hypothetical protein